MLDKKQLPLFLFYIQKHFVTFLPIMQEIDRLDTNNEIHPPPDRSHYLASNQFPHFLENKCIL